MKDRKVQDWLEEIDNAIEYREKKAYERIWPHLEDCYYNDPMSDAAIGPNLIFSEGDTLLSSLSVPDPEFLVEPDDIASVPNAPVVERIANRLAKREKLDLKRHVEEGALNSFLNSKLILKIGYDSEFGWDPTYDLGELNFPLGMSATQFDKQGNRIEEMNVTPGMPWVRAVNNADFVVPWGTGDDIENAPWVAHRIIRETAHFKKDPKYKNTSNLEPQMSARDYRDAYSFGSKNYRQKQTRLRQYSSTAPELLYNEVWEIHDRMHQRIICVCHTHDKFLRNSPHALMQAINGYPFVTAGFVKSSKHFWTPPLAFYLMPHQKEIFDTYKQIAKQRRINVAKFLMMDGLMSEAELDKLMSGDVGVVAKVKKKTNMRLNDVFMPFPKSPSYDLMNDSELIRRNTRDIMGFSRNQMGEFDASSRRTAYEAHRVFEGSINRQQSKQDVIRYAYINVMRKVLKMVSRYWTTPRPVAQGKDWMLITGKDLSGNFSFDVTLSTRSQMSKGARKQEALQMMLAFAQFPNVDLRQVEQHILDAVNDPSFEGFFTGVGQSFSPPPQQGAVSSGSKQRPVLGAGMSNNTSGGN